MPIRLRNFPLPLPLLLLLGASGCHPSREAHSARLPHVIVVTGEGEVKGRPDVARLTLGVEAKAADATSAVATMTASMRAVLDALKAAGVAEKDVQTNQLSIYSEEPPPPYPPPPYPPPEAPPMPRPTSAPMAAGKAAPMAAAAAVAAPPPPARPGLVYRVTNTVAVTVRQVDRLGDVLGAALAAGANQAGGIQFDVEDKKPLEDQARAKAMESARHRAEEIARLGGVKIGKVVSVAEGGDAEMPMPTAGYAMKMGAMRDASVVPTEEGQIAAHHEVRVVYEIAGD